MVIEPTPSKRLFVGRAQELGIFDQMLRRERPEWVAHILGPGGIGKTRLLEQVRDLARRQYADVILVTKEVVDFYKTAVHTPLGLLDDVVHQLGQKRFPEFVGAAQALRQLLATGTPDVSERHEAEERVINAFFEEYADLLAGKRVVLLFDTCEEMRGVESWMMDTFLPTLARLEPETEAQEGQEGETEEEKEDAEGCLDHTIVVMAGRRPLTFPELCQPWVAEVRLNPFTRGEVEVYFREGGLGPKKVSDGALTDIHKLSEGRLLYVALAFDWLYNDVGTVEELITPEEPFGKKLVSWVLRLGGHEAKAVLYMAQAWRRMEPSLLAHLLQIKEDEIEGVVTQLARFSFVKYRSPDEEFKGSIHLHDEMRELILEYAWPQFGSKDLQQQLLGQATDWYEEEIRALESDGVLRGEAPVREERVRYLLAEWLYYLCLIDLDDGVKRIEPIFRQAAHQLDLSFGELLNEELGRFRERLARPQVDELRFREALMAFRREQFEEAVDIWQSLIRQPDLDPPLRATVLLMLVEAETYTSRIREALDHAKEGEELYKSLLQDPAYESRRLELEVDLGRLYNNWGYTYRTRGDWKQALDYYDRALKLPGPSKNIARTLNNAGFVHFLRGDLVAARTYIGRSLSLRKRLDIPYELGLGYNTMGIVMEYSGRYDEGADLYDKALIAFEEAKSDRGRALALINLGRLRRVTNSFEDAIKYLTEARDILARKRDNDYLVEAMNELGCVYRQRGEEEDWEKALQWLVQSWELAGAIGNTFRETDNLEDLSVLHVKWANEEMEWGSEETAEEHLALAEEKGQEALRLAENYDYSYLRAKILRTFGDVAYIREEYERAFDRYLDACVEMVNVVEAEQGSVVQMQRRYEEIIDHLQEQLHGLASYDQVTLHAQRLRDELDRRGAADRLGELVRVLEQTLSVSQQIRVLEPTTSFG
jgi:tetratricopeptide (TPR) repeat protein